MSSTAFPIVEVNENKIVSVDGNVGHFYEMLPPDLEQMGPVEKDSFFEDIANGLNNLDLDGYFKFYNIDDKSYLETNAKSLPNFSQVEFHPKKDPLKVFFGGSEIFSDIGIYDDYLSFNGQYLRIFSAVEFSDEQAHEYLIPQGVNYVIFVKRKSKDKSISTLEKIRSGHLSSFLKSKRDIVSEGTYSQAEELLHDLIHGHECMFEMELFFILRVNTPEHLNIMSSSFVAQMLSVGIKTFSEGQSLKELKSGLACIFNELIPGVKPKLALRSLPNKTTHLRYLLPMNRSHLMDQGIELHDYSDNPIHFDPFADDVKNRNMLVTGISGGGKSVFVNKVVHHLIDKHPTVILDKGGSFKKLTSYHGGYSLEGGFNPLQFKDPLFLREIILSVLDQKNFGKLEKGRLLRSIKAAFTKVNTFSELLATLSNDFKDIDLYFEEFNHFLTDDPIPQTNILYIDVENFPKGVIAPIIIFILEYFKNIPTKEKILVFDECWSFLTEHSQYIEECFRTFRKIGAFPIAISQSLKDFSHVGKELAHSITNNSYFKVFFPQEITTNQDITDFDVSNIKSLAFKKNIYSECYLKSTDNRYRKIIRTYLSPLELELFHTEAGKDISMNLFMDRFSNLFESKADAINAYVRLKHEDHNDFYFNNNN